MKEINESGYALFKKLGNLSDAHITEASVCPERKGLPAVWKSFAGIAGLAAALALFVGLTVLVRPTKIDPSAGSETAESESENAPGTWSGETEPDPEEENACWFLYRGHKVVTETGLWYVSQSFDDPDKPGLEGDGMGLSFKLTEMEDAPTIWYDIDGTDKITYYETGVETEKAFRLWDSDGFSTLDFGADLYAYLYDHPGTYYLSCDRHVKRKIDGGTETAEFCEGVRLIAGDGVPETAPETELPTTFGSAVGDGVPETAPETEPETKPETGTYDDIPPLDALINLEIMDGKLRFQRIATTPCIVYSDTPISDMSKGTVYNDRHDILTTIFRAMDNKDAIMEASECEFSHYIYMFDKDFEDALWNYRFAVCDCGAVMITNNDEFLCTIKITEEERQSVLNALK